jgi:hypothetical protein
LAIFSANTPAPMLNPQLASVSEIAELLDITDAVVANVATVKLKGSIMMNNSLPKKSET